MRYLSVCSGIEAASCAWHPLGWRPVAFSEIGAFPSAVLAERWPEVPNLGDMTQFHHWPNYESVDVLVGGTPCQPFSIAGLREGLADPRGNLMLTYLAIAARYSPRWLVWENVPGVLSIDGGRAFGTLLGGMAKLGYGFAYRILDAQYVRVESHPRAVPQRRRRVFVVGCLGDWRRAAAVLFERESMCGHNPPRRETGKGVAGTLSARSEGGGGLGTDFELSGGLTPAAPVCGTLCADTHHTRGKDGAPEGVCPPLTADADKGDQDPLIFQTRIARNGRGAPVDVCPALNGSDAGETSDMRPCVQIGISVRRLMPLECERLQGFVDGYTAVRFNGRPAKDGPRYCALGNSMAVNVMSFIGRRIAMVNAL